MRRAGPENAGRATRACPKNKEKKELKRGRVGPVRVGALFCAYGDPIEPKEAPAGAARGSRSSMDPMLRPAFEAAPAPSRRGSPIVPMAPDSVDPTEPIESIEPIEPIEPAEPVDLIDPAEPIDPMEPADPIDPMDPAEPIDPIEPMEPKGRAGAARPDDPVCPKGAGFRASPPADPAACASRASFSARA